MEELEAIREAEEAALKSAEQAAEEAAMGAMNLDIIDEEDLMKPGTATVIFLGTEHSPRQFLERLILLLLHGTSKILKLVSIDYFTMLRSQQSCAIPIKWSGVQGNCVIIFLCIFFI